MRKPCPSHHCRTSPWTSLEITTQFSLFPETFRSSQASAKFAEDFKESSLSAAVGKPLDRYEMKKIIVFTSKEIP